MIVADIRMWSLILEGPDHGCGNFSVVFLCSFFPITLKRDWQHRWRGDSEQNRLVRVQGHILALLDARATLPIEVQCIENGSTGIHSSELTKTLMSESAIILKQMTQCSDYFPVIVPSPQPE